jgi:tetratricopeptide (TPR) repeat protein
MLATAQSPSSAATALYEKSQQSVFLITILNGDGKPVAFGSGFLIAPRTIATNAHVVENGSPVISIGPAKIPATISKIDRENDLAILTIAIDLDADPLLLDQSQPQVGEDVFVIGNPEGLEKTFSKGIVAGNRKLDNKELLQITAPISPGSSGGPVLDSKGRVVGIAVEFLTEGQNLNFAVPSKYLNNLVNAKQNVANTQKETQDSLEQAKKLIADRDNDQYSKDDNSPYQQKSMKILPLLRTGCTSDNPATLIEASKLLTDEKFDEGLACARKAASITDSPRAYYVIANNLAIQAIFSKDAERANDINQGIEAAQKSISKSKSPSSEAWSTLAFLRQLQGEPKEATYLYGRALSAPRDDWSEAKDSLLRGCIRNASDSEQPRVREDCFRQLSNSGAATADDFGEEGVQQLKAENTAQAVTYWEAADRKSDDGRYSCLASEYQIPKPENYDGILRDGRICLRKEMEKRSDMNDPRDLDDMLAAVNSQIAQVLIARGVYDEGLNYAREAAKLKPDSARAFDNIADATYFLERYQETIAAEQTAIRLSDGKFGYMHFRLGSAYVAQEKWNSAETEFRKAAELDPTDSSSTYNVAICLQREGFPRDAVTWYRETLRRSPNIEDRDQIQQKIYNLTH